MPDTHENVTPEVGWYPNFSCHSSASVSGEQTCKVGLQDCTLDSNIRESSPSVSCSGSKWAGSIMLESVETSIAYAILLHEIYVPPTTIFIGVKNPRKLHFITVIVSVLK